MTTLIRKREFVYGKGIVEKLYQKSKNSMHEVCKKCVNGRMIYAPISAVPFGDSKPYFKSSAVSQSGSSLVPQKTGRRSTILKSISDHMSGGMIRMF